MIELARILWDICIDVAFFLALAFANDIAFIQLRLASDAGIFITDFVNVASELNKHR